VIGAWPDARVRFVSTEQGFVRADAGLDADRPHRGEARVRRARAPGMAIARGVDGLQSFRL